MKSMSQLKIKMNLTRESNARMFKSAKNLLINKNNVLISFKNKKLKKVLHLNLKRKIQISSVKINNNLVIARIVGVLKDIVVVFIVEECAYQNVNVQKNARIMNKI